MLRFRFSAPISSIDLRQLCTVSNAISFASVRHVARAASYAAIVWIRNQYSSSNCHLYSSVKLAVCCITPSVWIRLARIATGVSNRSTAQGDPLEPIQQLLRPLHGKVTAPSTHHQQQGRWHLNWIPRFGWITWKLVVSLSAAQPHAQHSFARLLSLCVLWHGTAWRVLCFYWLLWNARPRPFLVDCTVPVVSGV